MRKVSMNDILYYGACGVVACGIMYTWLKIRQQQKNILEENERLKMIFEKEQRAPIQPCEHCVRHEEDEEN